MFFAQGTKVSYVGDQHDGTPRIGDEGIVVAPGNTASHVKWRTGAYAGHFQEVPHHAIVSLASAPDIDTFGTGVLSFSAHHIHRTAGVDGVIDALNEDGHLASFEEIAEEALAFVATKIRQDPAFQEVIATLGEDAGGDLVARASVRLLGDAFGRVN